MKKINKLKFIFLKKKWRKCGSIKWLGKYSISISLAKQWLVNWYSRSQRKCSIRWSRIHSWRTKRFRKRCSSYLKYKSSYSSTIRMDWNKKFSFSWLSRILFQRKKHNSYEIIKQCIFLSRKIFHFKYKC